HDSFIVEERHAGILKEIMDEVFSLTLRRIGGRRTTPTPLTKKVPQYGGGGGDEGAGVSGGANDNGSRRGGRPAKGAASVVAANDTSSNDRSAVAATTMMSEVVIVVSRNASSVPFIGRHTFFRRRTLTRCDYAQ